jgi:fumarate reductase iron-sulfur subunit
MSETLTLRVLRYDPDRDTEPRTQDYTVPLRDEWVVLDALAYIKDELDPTLAYRGSCHMALCGSCGMMIDRQPKLACHTFLRDYRGKLLLIEPLDHFPIERDLIVDQDGFLEKLASLYPYLIAEHERTVEQGEYRQLPTELAKFRPFAQCINCLLCYAACPQMAINPDFAGPAALALAHRYNQDSRDAGALARAEVTDSPHGVWDCTFVGACSTVCPKQVDPAAAIQQTKISASYRWLKARLLPGGKP